MKQGTYRCYGMKEEDYDGIYLEFLWNDYRYRLLQEVKGFNYYFQCLFAGQKFAVLQENKNNRIKIIMVI